MLIFYTQGGHILIFLLEKVKPFVNKVFRGEVKGKLK